LRIMAGVDKDFFGEGWPGGGNKKGYPPPGAPLHPTQTVKGNGGGGGHGGPHPFKALGGSQAQICRGLSPQERGELPPQQAQGEDKIDGANGWDLDRALESAMDALRCPPGDADVTTLSGGEKRRVALCKLLLSKPDLLLLDEPTNHLDADSVSWLEQHLKE